MGRRGAQERTKPAHSAWRFAQPVLSPLRDSHQSNLARRNDALRRAQQGARRLTTCQKDTEESHCGERVVQHEAETERADGGSRGVAKVDSRGCWRRPASRWRHWRRHARAGPSRRPSCSSCRPWTCGSSSAVARSFVSVERIDRHVEERTILASQSVKRNERQKPSRH